MPSWDRPCKSVITGDKTIEEFAQTVCDEANKVFK